jgi:hypothetical protein
VAIAVGKRHALTPNGWNYRAGIADEVRASNLGMRHGRRAYRTLFT